MELLDVHEHPEMAQVRSRLKPRHYAVLLEPGDSFSHWTTSMYDVGDVAHDPTLGGLDEATHQEQEATS